MGGKGGKNRVSALKGRRKGLRPNGLPSRFDMQRPSKPPAQTAVLLSRKVHLAFKEQLQF